MLSSGLSTWTRSLHRKRQFAASTENMISMAGKWRWGGAFLRWSRWWSNPQKSIEFFLLFDCLLFVIELWGKIISRLSSVTTRGRADGTPKSSLWATLPMAPLMMSWGSYWRSSCSLSLNLAKVHVRWKGRCSSAMAELWRRTSWLTRILASSMWTLAWVRTLR